MSQACTYNGVEYKSKSEGARSLLEEGNMKKGDIAKDLGITYQTVHAIQKSMEKSESNEAPTEAQTEAPAESSCDSEPKARKSVKKKPAKKKK